MFALVYNVVTSWWTARQCTGPSCTLTVMMGECWVSITSHASRKPGVGLESRHVMVSTVHPGGEEQGGPGGAPRPVRQLLRAGVHLVRETVISIPTKFLFKTKKSPYITQSTERELPYRNKQSNIVEDVIQL